MGRRLPAVPAPAGALRPAAGNLPTEVFAGITLAALCLPLNIGYAEAAGLPAVVGIYATLAPLVVYSCTAGSRPSPSGCAARASGGHAGSHSASGDCAAC